MGVFDRDLETSEALDYVSKLFAVVFSDNRDFLHIPLVRVLVAEFP